MSAASLKGSAQDVPSNPAGPPFNKHFYSNTRDNLYLQHVPALQRVMIGDLLPNTRCGVGIMIERRHIR